jgi:hypothetical protein
MKPEILFFGIFFTQKSFYLIIHGKKMKNKNNFIIGTANIGQKYGIINP